MYSKRSEEREWISVMRVSFDGRFSIVISLEDGGGGTHRFFGVESFSVVIR